MGKSIYNISTTNGSKTNRCIWKHVQKGYIYKGLKPVYWCTDCETALAEAEIEYKDIKSNTAYVKFPVIEGKGLFDERDTYVVIWTTTPWTLPGNTGITISPEFKYSLVDVQGEKTNNGI